MLFNETIATEVKPFLEFTNLVSRCFSRSIYHPMVNGIKNCEEGPRDRWDNSAQMWPSSQSTQVFFAIMYTLLKNIETVKEGEKWLSLGSGPAMYETWLSHKLGLNFHVTDFSPEMIQVAKRISEDFDICEEKSHAARLKFSVMSMENIFYQKDSIDSIVSFNAIQWVPAWRKVISEVSRVLKQNGNYYLVFPAHLMILDEAGNTRAVADTNRDTVFDELEKNNLQILTTCEFEAATNEPGFVADRFFVKARKTESQFNPWRKRFANKEMMIVR